MVFIGKNNQSTHLRKIFANLQILTSISRQLLIRADASKDIGIGHIMRMIALAQAWQDAQGIVTLSYMSCPPKLLNRLEEENISTIKLDISESGGATDAHATIQQAQQHDCLWVVLDGYFITVEYQKLVKSAGLKLLMIDDYGHCDYWHSDLLLNQNLHATEMRESYHDSSICHNFLLGPKYALLRREFKLSRTRLTYTESRLPIRILITFGGADPENWTLKLLQIILTCEFHIKATAIIGPGYGNTRSLAKLKSTDTVSISIHSNVEDMPLMYSNSDCIISAAGSSTYEWLRYCLPALVFAIAENQKPAIPYLKKLPHVKVYNDSLGYSADTIMEEIEKLISTSMSSLNKYTPFVDAFGANRVVSEMLN